MNLKLNNTMIGWWHPKANSDQSQVILSLEALGSWYPVPTKFLKCQLVEPRIILLLRQWKEFYDLHRIRLMKRIRYIAIIFPPSSPPSISPYFSPSPFTFWDKGLIFILTVRWREALETLILVPRASILLASVWDQSPTLIKGIEALGTRMRNAMF